MRPFASAAVVTMLVLSCAASVFGWSSSQPLPLEGKIGPLTRTADARPDLEAVMNFPGRVYGETGFFNGADWENLYYRGDTKAFNRFLALCAEIKTKPIYLTVTTGKGMTSRRLGAKTEPVPCDWYYNRYLPDYQLAPSSADEIVTVEVWTEGQVDVSKITIPGGFVVRRDPRAVAEGDVVFDKAIPLKLSVGAQDKPDIVRLESVTFVRKDGHAWADFGARVVSWPKGKWTLRISILDAKVDSVQRAEAVIENSGIIRGVAAVEESKVRVDLGPSGELTAPSRYYIQLESFAEVAPAG